MTFLRFSVTACACVLAAACSRGDAKAPPDDRPTGSERSGVEGTGAGRSGSSGRVAAGSGGGIPSAGAGAGQRQEPDDDAGTADAATDPSLPVRGAFTAEQLAAQSCDVNRPGFAYRAAQSGTTVAAMPMQGTLAPVPCLRYTGFGSADPTLGIARDGSVFVAPAFAEEGVSVLRSSDFGASWQLLQPDRVHSRRQPYLEVDDATDRIFFATTTVSVFGPAGFSLSISADLGASWGVAELAPDAIDRLKIFAGPPRTSTPDGYPNFVYAAAPAPFAIATPLSAFFGLTPESQSIYRSDDGGESWERVARESLVAADVSGCPEGEWIGYGAGAVDARGNAYLALRRCRSLAIAASSDEGERWTIRDVPNATLPPFEASNTLRIVEDPNVLVGEQLAIDRDGTLYVAWVDDRGGLRFAFSRDGAATWSAPIAAAAPEVVSVRYVAIAVRSPGVVALAYYGSTDRQTYDGYVAETEDAFVEEPRFTSVILNDPSRPLFPWGFDTGYLAVDDDADRNEHIRVRYAPNGDLWVSMLQDMCESATTTRCSWDLATHTNSPYQGVVGRMVRGSSPRWGAPRAAAPNGGEPSCDPTPDATAQCSATLRSEEVCASLARCACDACVCPLLACEADPRCAAVRRCALDNDCRGSDCLFSCQEVALDAGERATARALDVTACLVRSGCPASCSPL